MPKWKVLPFSRRVTTVIVQGEKNEVLYFCIYYVLHISRAQIVYHMGSVDLCGKLCLSARLILKFYFSMLSTQIMVTNPSPRLYVDCNIEIQTGDNVTTLPPTPFT